MKRVLYIEDSITSQVLMRKYLPQEYELTIASSPRQAAHHVLSQPYDLVITDFLFPDGDAFDAIHDIRRLAPHDKLPIIVVSSAMDESLLVRVLKAGANEALHKPIDVPAFRALVPRMIETPYVRALDPSLMIITCLQWKNGEKTFEYSPDIGLTVTAASREETSFAMVAALQQRIGYSAALGRTHGERIVTHVIKRPAG